MAVKNVLMTILGVGLVVCIGCKSKGKNENPASNSDKKPFELLPPETTGLDFVNQIDESPRLNGVVYEYLYNGGGIAAGDFNSDGLVDLYFTSNLEPNELYLNKGGLQFQRATAQAGLRRDQGGFSTGVTTVDINSDGRLDIYVSKSGNYDDPDLRRNELYINTGNNSDGVPVFVEKAVDYGLDVPDHSTQAAFFDFDRDGDLDMFLLNHNTDPGETEANLDSLLATRAIHSNNKLFRNDNNHFMDVSTESGIVNNGIGYGLGLAISDLNNDGWPDIIVGMDYSERDHMYINERDGTFKEVMNRSTNHISNFSMGNDVADINNDGLMDFISVDMVSNNNYDLKTNMSGMNPERFYGLVDKGLHHQYMFNTVQLNQGNMLDGGNVPAFSDIAQHTGLAATNWSWAPLFFDMDNDGWQDLFVSNGVLRSFRNNDFIQYKRKRVAKLYEDMETFSNKDSLIADYYGDILRVMPEKKEVNLLYLNNSDFTFSEMNKAWEMDVPTVTNGAVYVDLDNDGDLDIVGNNINNSAIVYKNNTREVSKEHHYLKIKFKGRSKNPFGIGCKVTVVTDSMEQAKELYVSRGFQSSIEPLLHFGLGNANTIKSLKVEWPDGKIEELNGLTSDQTLMLDQKDAVMVEDQTPKKEPKPIFKTVNGLSELFGHKENKFDDFKKEILLPHRYSQNGPALAVGDINNDGLDDFFVGGAMDQPAAMFVQKAGMTFESSNKPVWIGDRAHEDIAAEFFDVDNDGDLDLYVVSGGNEKEEGNAYYKDRLYINNGTGSFEKAPGAIPDMRISGSCLRYADYDNDGDLDVFMGGRTIPGKYPLPAPSKILRNDTNDGKVKFVDVTDQIAPFLEKLGMVTSAQWADIDNDNDLDLVIAGEWMPITILQNHNGHFNDITSKTVLKDGIGWWYSIALADFDNDGDLDMIVGNLGNNYKYKASTKAPFEVYTNDFDQNGSLDIVLGYHEEGKAFPLRGRQCSSDQMPFIKKKFSTYNEFGRADLIEVYGKENLKASLHYAATDFSSVYVENLGDLQFKITELPEIAQFSSINSILVEDFNGDGNLDAMLSGNLYQSEVETARNDAGYGLFLSGNGAGGFTSNFPYQSGLFVKGDVKGSRLLSHVPGQKKYVLFAKNNDQVQWVSY